MSKPYLPYGQQIQKLIHDKGLIINDINYAERMLTDIGYFSLIGGYKNLFINPMTRKYVGGTTFEDILALYHFDEELRTLTFTLVCLLSAAFEIMDECPDNTKNTAKL